VEAVAARRALGKSLAESVEAFAEGVKKTSR
jgi:hypothetical protein